MKISIITVCYNSAPTLERTLESVAGQLWENKQHIIIDGGSTDESSEILSQYRSQLDYVISEPDSGIYDAMNKGIANAEGDVICFLNADDYYISPNILSHVAHTMREYDLDALTADVVFFHRSQPDKIIRRYRSDRFNPKLLAWGWMPAHPSLFLNKRVVERVGGFKTDYRIAGDFEYIIRVFHNQNVNYRHMAEVYVCMQMGGISNSGLGSKLLLNQEMLRACRENGLRTNILKIMSRYPLKLFEMFPHKI